MGIGEHLCKIILNLDQWFRRCHLKIFLIYSSGDHFVPLEQNHFVQLW